MRERKKRVRKSNGRIREEEERGGRHEGEAKNKKSGIGEPTGKPQQSQDQGSFGNSRERKGAKSACAPFQWTSFVIFKQFQHSFHLQQ